MGYFFLEKCFLKHDTQPPANLDALFYTPDIYIEEQQWLARNHA